MEARKTCMQQYQRQDPMKTGEQLGGAKMMRFGKGSRERENAVKGKVLSRRKDVLWAEKKSHEVRMGVLNTFLISASTCCLFTSIYL